MQYQELISITFERIKTQNNWTVSEKNFFRGLSYS